MSRNTGVITTEPKARNKEIESFVRDLDPLQVAGEAEIFEITAYLRVREISKTVSRSNT